MRTRRVGNDLSFFESEGSDRSLVGRAPGEEEG
jgi:hypothetical protein